MPLNEAPPAGRISFRISMEPRGKPHQRRFGLSSLLSSVALLKVPREIYNRLLVEFLRSPFFYGQMRGFMKGAAITRVTLKRMAPALIPLPLVSEQHRIVAKIDEMMSLCDQLEAAQAEREERRDRLAASALHRLNKGHDREELQENARFYLNRLPMLTARSEHVTQVRHTILMRGWLTQEVRDLTKAVELRLSDATEFVADYARGVLTPKEADDRLIVTRTDGENRQFPGCIRVST